MREILNKIYRFVFFGDFLLKCGFFLNRKGILLRDLFFFVLNFICVFVIIFLFRRSYNLSIGEELYLECYVMGLSFSKIIWRLLNGTLLDKENLRIGRYEIRNNSRFILRYLYESDIGRYFCEV